MKIAKTEKVSSKITIQRNHLVWKFWTKLFWSILNGERTPIIIQNYDYFCPINSRLRGCNWNDSNWLY